MKKIVLFTAIILLSISAKSGDIVKPPTVNVANDTTSFAVFTHDYLAIAESKNSISVINSEEITIEGTFCDIMSKDTLKCIPSTINALSTGLVTKIFKKVGGQVKSVVVSYSGKNYVYSFRFLKSKATNGAEQFVLDGKVTELLYKGKLYKISASSTAVCKLYVNK